MKGISKVTAVLLIVALLVIAAFLLVTPSAALTNATHYANASSRPEDNNGGRIGSTGQIMVTLNAGQYEIKPMGEYIDIVMEDFGSILNPGEPKLPARTFLVGVPPGAKVTSVSLISESHKDIPGTYRIVPAPPFASSGEPPKWGEDREIYSSEEPYPQNVFEYLGMTQMRKYSIAMIRFCPVVYSPSTGKLVLYERITLKVEYQIVEKVPDELLADAVMNDVASRNIVNYPAVAPQYAPPPMAPSAPSYDYVIITTESLESSVSSLVTWKESIGYSVKVVNTTWISSQYSGADLPEEIRNFLNDTYAEWGIEYVLIVGSHSAIPMRVCSPQPGGGSLTPTDYYYADLTGDWDSDDDGYYGEYGEDNVDFTPEVYVGRIPTDDAGKVSSICDKTKNFEQTENTGWKRKALMLGAISNYENEDNKGYGKTDGATLTYEMRTDILDLHSYTYERMNEQGGRAQKSVYPYEHPLSHTNVMNGSYGWPSGYGIVNWWAHGSYSAAYRKVWTSDDGDGVPESGEMSWYYFIINTDNSALDDSKPAIVFSCACANSDPDYSNNLGKSLLEQGAVAFVGATNISWYSVGWQDESWGGNAAIDYYFFHYLINHDQKSGKALYNSKVYYRDNFGWDNWGYCWWQNMFDFCLYGDPTVGTAKESPTIVTSCDSSGTEMNQFAPNQSVYVKAEGLDANTNYTIWIQDDPVNESDSLIVGENPSSAETPKGVTTDGSGNLAGQPILIWSIPAEEPITHHKYDIVINKGTSSEENQTYNAVEDGLDSASVAGFVTPVPELSTIILFSAGLLALAGYVGWRRKKE